MLILTLIRHTCRRNDNAVLIMLEVLVVSMDCTLIHHGAFLGINYAAPSRIIQMQYLQRLTDAALCNPSPDAILQ